MHINKLEISNFKSIKHQVIEGCKRINVFIGYPNVGKSAILEAISSLSYFQQGYQEPFSSLCRVKYFNELFHNGGIRDKATIICNNIYKAQFEYDAEHYLQSIFSFLILPENGGIPVGGKRGWNKIRAFGFRINGNTDSSESSFSGIELPTVKKYTFRQEHNSEKTNGLALEAPFGKNLVDVVQFNQKVRKAVATLFQESGLLLNFDLSSNAIRAQRQVADNIIFTVPFYQLADTLQRLIFHKAAILSNKDAVLLFEEPEAHMFPPYIRKFTADIMLQENGNQYFINTHSPYVLSDFMEDETTRNELSVYLVGIKEGETQIVRLTDEQLQEVHEYGVDLFYNIESYLP